MSIFGFLGGKRANDYKKSQNVAKIREDRRNLLTPKSDFFIREAYKTLKAAQKLIIPL